MNSKVYSLGCLGLLCITPGIAQGPAPIGELTMKTSIGGFKITSPGDVKAFGKVQMSFKGTVLVVGYEGKTPIQMSSGLRTEYQNDKRERIEYFGQGTITLDGKFKAIQFFGQDLNLTWVGNGICRVYGEFDKNGNSGTFQVKGDIEREWGSGGTTFTIPPRESIQAKPKVIIKGSGKGSGG